MSCEICKHQLYESNACTSCVAELGNAPSNFEPIVTFHSIATEIASTVETKNIQYGDAINATGEFLKLLYPNGIPTDKYNDIGVLARVYDKLKRIASGHKEDSWEDICGYAILMIERNKNARND